MVAKGKGQGLLARVTDPDENSGRLPTGGGGKASTAHRMQTERPASCHNRYYLRAHSTRALDLVI
jgi:hypothetical protein